jgi:hypothetical protein
MRQQISMMKLNTRLAERGQKWLESETPSRVREMIEAEYKWYIGGASEDQVSETYKRAIELFDNEYELPEAL